MPDGQQRRVAHGNLLVPGGCLRPPPAPSPQVATLSDYKVWMDGWSRTGFQQQQRRILR